MRPTSIAKASFPEGIVILERAFLIGVVLSVASCTPCNPPPAPSPGVPSPGVPSPGVFKSFDAFNQALIDRIDGQIRSEEKTKQRIFMKDFQIIAVTSAGYPVGTLLRRSPIIPVSASACQFDETELISADAPTLFPSYELEQSVAVNLGFSYTGLASLAAGIDNTSTIKLAIADAKIWVVSDQGLQRALSTESCRSALQPNTIYRLVRGIVEGKRAFTLGGNFKGQGEAKVDVGGNAQIVQNGGPGMVKVEDAGPVTFAMIIADVVLPATVLEPVKTQNPSNTEQARETLIVQASEDNVQTSKLALTLLSQSRVDTTQPKVLYVARAKLPKSAEVRFFDANDRKSAEEIASALRKGFPTIEVRFINSLSHREHFEIWLPPAPHA